MPLPVDSPVWVQDMAAHFDSGAAGQFILSGNVRDRQVLADGRLGDLDEYLLDVLLKNFPVVLAYSLGSGLELLRADEACRQFFSKLPRPDSPLAMARQVSSWLRYLYNLRSLGRGGEVPQVACLIRDAHLVLPVGGDGALMVTVRDWASAAPWRDLPFCSILIADTLSELHPLIGLNPRAVRLELPLPDEARLSGTIRALAPSLPKAVGQDPDQATIARELRGVSAGALESLLRRRNFEGKPIQRADLDRIKRQLVETEAQNLISFIPARRTMGDYHGQPALKEHLAQDAKLWQQGVSEAMPMGYLLAGPVGTGKTFLVECLAGSIGVPVVKLGNFRDRWVGSSEGNLERIFRLLSALGRCVVFIDEADQSLGRRDSGTSDGGLSGRLYGMMAQAMGDGSNRGKLLWVLASSRPDLIEVDLKRPGRIDVKIPLLPTTTPVEGAALLGALLRRRKLDLSDALVEQIGVPDLLTPGAAEALVIRTDRLRLTSNLSPEAALRQSLTGYQPPVHPSILRQQMILAIREATDLAFVPERLRPLVDEQV